jgi:hypothetical protein
MLFYWDHHEVHAQALGYYPLVVAAGPPRPRGLAREGAGRGGAGVVV